MAENRFAIGLIYSPFYVTVAHEFIHLKHFLDTYLGIDKMGCGHAASIKTYVHVLQYRLNTLPELSEINMLNEEDRRALLSLMRIIPWDNFEERRTVCGPDIDGISETAFRIAEGLPIRYIYQGQHFFWEDSVVVQKIVEGVFCESQKFFLQGLNVQTVLAQLPRGFYSFGIEGNSKGDGYDYSPLKVRQLLLTDEQIVANSGILSKNKSKALEFLRNFRPS